CQVIRRQNYDKTSITTLDCGLETRLTRVGGWLKTESLSGNGMHQVSLIHPETGKTYEVVQKKTRFIKRWKIKLWTALISRCNSVRKYRLLKAAPWIPESCLP
ncbi:hypothetical protein, partial [Holdemania massiliensis]